MCSSLASNPASLLPDAAEAAMVVPKVTLTTTTVTAATLIIPNPTATGTTGIPGLLSVGGVT